MAEIDYIHPEDDPNQGNTPPPPNVPAVTTVPADDQSRSRAEEQIKRFYSASIPEPKVDEKKLDRINRMGKINQLSKGVGVVGDILGLALGANVRKKAPDETTSRLQQEYLATLDRHKKDLDVYNMQKFQIDRENSRFAVDRADKDQAEDRHNKDREAADMINQRNNETSMKKYLIDQGYKGDVLKQRIEEFKWKKANGGGSSSQKERDKYTVRTQAKQYPLAPDEFEYYKGVALQNTTELKKKYHDWFVQVPERDEYGDAVPGKFTLKLDNRVNDKDLVRAMMEMQEESQANPPADKPTYIWKTPGIQGMPEQVPATAKQPTGTVTGPPKPAKQKPAYSSLNF